MTLKTGLLSGLLLLSVCGLAQQTPIPPLDIPQDMKQYFIGLLVKGDKFADPQTPDERGRLTQKHLAYIRTQTEAGKYVMAGPLTDNSRIGGMVVIQVASMQEARKIVDADPMIVSGRMAVELHSGMLPDLSNVKVVYPKTAAQ
jgi:uncharacterized protein YciI